MAQSEVKQDLVEIKIKVPKGYTPEHFTPIILAYAQWIEIDIQNKSGTELIIENASLSWGKWYASGNKGKELGNPDKTKIDNGNSFGVYSCGRENSASGSQGSFDLKLFSNGKATTRICTMSWDCPWGLKGNSYDVSNKGVGWYPSLSGGSKDSGAIGTVTLVIPPYVN
eukprot:169657_1